MSTSERDAADPMVASVREQAADLLDDAIALRRRLHEWPELGNDLPVTREQVLTSLGTATASPYSIEWDTTQIADGAVALTAMATDADGNVGTSAPVN